MSAGALFAAPVLVSHLNVLDNIRLPWIVEGRSLDQPYLDVLVDTLELGDVLFSYPADLSDELQFRVAGVRALAGRPTVVQIYPCSPPSQRLDDLVFLAEALGQPVRLVGGEAEGLSEGEAITAHGSEGAAIGELPETLDEIAPPRELSAHQALLVDKAQQILDLLPGPNIEIGGFLQPSFEENSSGAAKIDAHNQDLADNS